MFPSVVNIRPCPKCKDIKKHEWPSKIPQNTGHNDPDQKSFKMSLENWFQETDVFLATVGSEFSSTISRGYPKDIIQSLHTAHASCQCHGCVGSRPKKRRADTAHDPVTQKLQKLGPTQHKALHRESPNNATGGSHDTMNLESMAVDARQSASYQVSEARYLPSPPNSQYGRSDGSNTSSYNSGTHNPVLESIPKALDGAALSSGLEQHGVTGRQGKNNSGFNRALEAIRKAFLEQSPPRSVTPEHLVAQTHLGALNAQIPESHGRSPLQKTVANGPQQKHGQADTLQSNTKRKNVTAQSPNANDRAIKRVKAQHHVSESMGGFQDPVFQIPTNVDKRIRNDHGLKTSANGDYRESNALGISVKNNEMQGSIGVRQFAQPVKSQAYAPESQKRTLFQKSSARSSPEMMKPVANSGAGCNHGSSFSHAQKDHGVHRVTHRDTHPVSITGDNIILNNNGRPNESIAVVNGIPGSNFYGNKYPSDSNVHHNPKPVGKLQLSHFLGPSCRFLGRETKVTDLVSLQQSVDNVWGISYETDHQDSHFAVRTPSLSSTSSVTVDSTDEEIVDHQSATGVAAEAVPEKEVLHKDKFGEKGTIQKMPSEETAAENECKQDVPKQNKQALPTEDQSQGDKSAQQSSKSFEEEMASMMDEAHQDGSNEAFTHDEFNSLLEGFFEGF
ncbi:hypothetical protein PFICI_08419 [Pestalotiopsis fici W106-1]|uniref:Uncharacterized protein n=1 Tax=Pestalotiopsis fici (strain W106-1 / CGMCC3.15140) TaxID=1229662 RepID=W3X4A3_PESFW|nr:uncharacterized protein PFICI_08419 [Pestalotiopsis fici W106-1]ETS80890.1 hypothetical protein PFICI_08419 [Pestalotiopsis fici W106-1]